MAQYPIKMLKDENGTPFVPLVAPEAVKDGQGFNLQTVLGNKLEKTNIIAGSNITLSVSGNDITINSQAGGATTNVIDNLNQQTAGVGVLDAHQGYVLKGMIPGVQNSLTSTSTTDALSAYQGYLLSNRSVPSGGTTGQVLKKKSNTDNDLEWGSLPTLATVATTGAYSDLSGKPTIPTVTDNVTSTSTTSALSANQGKLLNDKFGNYSLSTHTHGLLHNDFTVLLPNSTTDNGWSLINPTYTGYLLKSIRGNSQSPSWFTSNYAAGIAFGGADTKGVISLSYNGNERITKFAGGNGTKPVWWYGIKGASGAIYDLADIKTKVDSNSWSSSVTLYNSGGNQVYYRVNTGLKLVSVVGSAPAGTNVLGTIPYKPHDKDVWVEIPTGGSRAYFSIDTSGKLTTFNQDSSSHGFYTMYTYN